MPEALTLANERLAETMAVLETAAGLDVTVVVSASMLQDRVAKGLPDAVRQPLGSLPTDAQTALQFVRSSPGVTTALVGMSSVAHVEEDLSLREVQPVGPDAFAELFG